MRGQVPSAARISKDNPLSGCQRRKLGVISAAQTSAMWVC